jgi:ketosteroid isomerase-like protein
MIPFIFKLSKMKNQTHSGVKLTICIACLLFSNCSINKLEQKRLLDRITATEDRLEILNLLAGSAFSSDVASAAYWKKMFTDDAVFDRGQGLQDKGRTDILKIVNDPSQKEASKAGMTHLAMLPHITLKGDSAVATGYLLIVMPDSAASHVKLAGKGVSSGFSIFQVTTNRWQLVRTADGWKVSKRTVRPLSSDDSHTILERAIEGFK